MPLPSQTLRSGGSAARFSGGGGRRRRGRRRRFLPILALLVVAAGVWFFWPREEGMEPVAMIPGGPAEAVAAGPGGAASEPDRPRLPQDSIRDGGASALEASAARVLANTPAAEAEPEPPARTPTMTMGRTEQASTDPAPARTPPAPTPEPEPERDAAPRPTDPALAGLSPGVRTAIARADEAMDRNRPVEARDAMNRALYEDVRTERDAAELRGRLAAISQIVTFSPRVFPEDQTADIYVIQPGDSLAAVPSAGGFHVDFRFIQRVNKIANPNIVRVGQRLKVVYGPFHAVVDKSDFRMDVYADQTDSGGNRLYVRSFPVGLGEYGSTPEGAWRVRSASKLINPKWVNPRTGEVFGADDPMNPIGERWIGLEGDDPNTEVLSGYGIHGTIEPESIGEEASMGCIRLLSDDVALVYEMLVPRRSTVRIVP